jgi:pilus assembly protein CpaE
MLDMLRISLTDGQHEVFLSQSGQEGLKIAQKELPDLAIVDVMMPEMNGYDVVRKLRANPDTADMAIIILTARGQAVDRVAALEAGADQYLSKPIKPQDLLDEIHRILSANSRTKASGLFPVFSCRGGAGTTTLATNIAILFQQLNKTALIDLSPNTGHCASYLGLSPQRHWGRLLQAEGSENPQKLLSSLLLQHSSGLRLLAAPPTPIPVGQLTKERVSLMISTLEKYASFVVVDMPSLIGSFTPLVLEKATNIILVSGSDPFSIQTTRGTLNLLKKVQDKVLLVLNTPSLGRKFSLAAVEKTLGMPVTAQIPFHEEEINHKMKGTPTAIQQPEAALVFHLQKFIRSMLAQQA